MVVRMEQTSATNTNPVLSVDKNGYVLYSNDAGITLLNEWSVKVGEKLPPHIGDFVQRVISLNSPEKMEVKIGNRLYQVVFSPLPEQELVSISGFDISEQKEVERKLRERENKYRNIVETSVEGIWIFNAISKTTYVNNKMAEMLGYKPEEMIGRFIWDFASEDDMGIFQVKLANRKQGIDEVYELKLMHKDGSILWFSVSAKGFFDDAGKFEGSVGMFTDVTDRRRAEEALQESKARIESIFRSSPVGIGVVVNRIIKEANVRLCEMTGYSREELLGKSALILYPTTEEYERAGLVKYNMIAEYGTGHVETLWQRKDGSIINILLSSSPVISDDLTGEITFSALDITKRKQYEEALQKSQEFLEEKVKERTAELENAYNSLQESEKRLAEAQKMAHIGDWEWDIKTDNAYWSDEMYCIFGREPQKLAPPYKEYINYIHPDDRDQAEIIHKEAVNGKPFSMDRRIVLANGNVRLIHMQTEIIFDDDNIPIKLKGTIQDITQRKSVEENLKESEEKYRNIVETANEGINLIDSEGVIIFTNKKMADILGYDIDEIVGRTIWDFVEDENKPFVTKHFVNRSLNIIEDYEIKLIRKDGTPVWVYINSKPFFDNSGKFIGILAMHTDITKRKEAEEALNYIEVARKKEIHHRIKNNLQVISSLLDLQADKIRNKKNIIKSEVLEAFRESQDRVISMALIHEELHKGGKLDTLNFSHYIEELSDNLLLTYRLGNESISLDKDIEEGIFFDMDTAVPLGMIINELVSNSFKYAFPSRNKGEIKINLHNEECKSNKFILSVSDNGIGIPEDFNIENLESLGLQLVTTLVEQLDGELELRRNNGTEFIIRFSISGKNDQEFTSGQMQLADNE